MDVYEFSPVPVSERHDPPRRRHLNMRLYPYKFVEDRRVYAYGEQADGAWGDATALFVRALNRFEADLASGKVQLRAFTALPERERNGHSPTTYVDRGWHLLPDKFVEHRQACEFLQRVHNEGVRGLDRKTVVRALLRYYEESWAAEPSTFDDDLLVVDARDLADETRLRFLVTAVERYLGLSERIDVRTPSSTAWAELLRASGGTERFSYVRREPMRLLASPAAVVGANSDNPVIVAHVVYSALRCLPSGLSPVLRRGLDDVLAAGIAAREGLDMFTDSAPAEHALVDGLVSVLVREYGHGVGEWAPLLRRDPERFFYHVRKSAFALAWLKAARHAPATSAALAAVPSGQKKAALVALIRSPQLTADSPLVQLTSRCARDYLDA